MLKSITGYCPAQDKDYTISVDYIDTSDLSQKSYAKGIAHCDYNIYGDKCDSSKCPKSSLHHKIFNFQSHLRMAFLIHRTVDISLVILES